jgi:hypothetical protein
MSTPHAQPLHYSITHGAIRLVETEKRFGPD